MRFIARTIIRPSAQTLVTIGKGDAEIIEVMVKNTKLIHTPISKIENNTDKYKIITIYTEEDMLIPTNETELNYNDSIAILVKNDYVNEVRDYFTKEE